MLAVSQNPNAESVFREWRRSLVGSLSRWQRFDEWVFLNAAPVLLDEKTGELLALDLDELELSEGDARQRLNELSVMWSFDFRWLRQDGVRAKLIIYHQARLQEVLDGVPFCIMTAKLNYPTLLRAGEFLDEIRKRWAEAETVPHEIGLALGYPVDDVFGYMGLLPLSCKGACGWQVYGCMKESERRSCAFERARCQAIIFLAELAQARAHCKNTDALAGMNLPFQQGVRSGAH